MITNKSCEYFLVGPLGIKGFGNVLFNSFECHMTIFSWKRMLGNVTDQIQKVEKRI